MLAAGGSASATRLLEFGYEPFFVDVGEGFGELFRCGLRRFRIFERQRCAAFARGHCQRISLKLAATILRVA
jgi:hypothetical protein